MTIERFLMLFTALLSAPIGARPLLAQDTPSGGSDRVTLEEALELFDRHSLELAIARAEARATSGEARQSAAYPNPLITGTHEPLSDGDVTVSESYLNLTQRLVWPGTRSAVSAAATHAVEAARSGYAADSAALVFEVRSAYVAAALAERVEETVRRVTEVFREGDDAAEARYAEEDISLYERRRIRAELIGYEGRLAEAELEAADARRRFSALVVPTDEARELAPAGLPEGRPPSVGVRDVESAALVGRPDVAAAEAALESARAGESAARRGRIPDLAATGGYKTQSDGLTGAFLGLSIALPLWDRQGGAVQAAEARSRAEEARLAQVRRRVAREAANAREAYEQAVRRAELVGEPPEAKEDLLDIATVAYAEGEMELIELLDAAEALLEAELARIRIRADLWIHYYDLERAVGGFGESMSNGGLE